MPRKENIRRPVHAIRNAEFKDSITLSDEELETLTEQDIAEMVEARALAYADFVAVQSALVTPEVEVGE